MEEIFDGKKVEESIESQKILITRSLLLDFSDKSEITDASECSSALTQAEGDNGDCKDKSFTDEENSSVWSIQVNASTLDEDLEEEEADEDEFKEDNYQDYSGEEEEEGHGESLEDLCSGIMNMSIMATTFEGKHTRFVYNSDDEIVGGEEEGAGETGEGGLFSPSILRLKGMPTPRGKHMRFPVVEGDNEAGSC